MIKRGKKKIISVILTAALVFTTVFGAGFAYAGSSVSGFTGTTYTHNSRFNDRILIHGVDVSTYQNGIDWNDAKAAGVDFAIIRIGFRGYGDAARRLVRKKH